MENTIIIVLNALGALGERGVHYVLGLIETRIVASSTEIDNSIFYKVINAVKSYEFQNPTE